MKFDSVSRCSIFSPSTIKQSDIQKIIIPIKIDASESIMVSKHPITKRIIEIANKIRPTINIMFIAYLLFVFNQSTKPFPLTIPPGRQEGAESFTI